MLARYGGEELHSVKKYRRRGAVIQRKTRTAVQDKPFKVGGHSISLMISLSVAG